MHFVPEAVPAEIPAQMNRLISITGWAPWKRRLHWLEQQVRTNPTMPFFLKERFGLELALLEVRRHYEKSGRYLWPPKTPDHQRFYSLLTMIVRCHQRLNAAGKQRLSGMLESALEMDYGLGPLAFEMKVATHLMHSGFDVKFHDMEEGGGYDYFATKDEIAMEVECKFISGDIGRQIHLKRLHQLSTTLLEEMEEDLKGQRRGRLVHIVLPNRLGGNVEQHLEIRQVLSNALKGSSLNSGKLIKVSVSDFDFEDSPFHKIRPSALTVKDIQKFLAAEFELENKNALVRFHPNSGAILVVVECAKKDTVLKGIHRQLKDAARRQLTGQGPGMLCCGFADLTEQQLRNLKSSENVGTGLQAMVSDLLVRRPNIHTVSFTTAGTMQVRETKTDYEQQTEIQEISPSYTFINSNHPLANDSRYKVF